MNEANNMVNKLKGLYHSEKFHFDFNVSVYISGDANKKLRQNIMQIVTGKSFPVSKCNLSIVRENLKAYYEQPKLF